MEIIRGTSPTVTYKLPDIYTQVSSVYWKGPRGEGDLPFTINYNTTTAEVKLPYLSFDGPVEVIWILSVPDYGDATEYTYYEVVTPLLTTEEILEIHPNATPGEITRIEQAVRHIINAHTGQTFGRSAGPRRVRGSGNNVLNLPEKLISLSSVNGVVNNSYFLDARGYTLRYSPWGVPPLKADYFGLHYTTNGVIHNPNNVHLGVFETAYEYIIDGEWGWKYVPQQVKEAAKLLVNDYACGDASYRDRYLTSMTAADWRIQFNNKAFYRTGNVRADQLLEDFVISNGWSIV